MKRHILFLVCALGILASSAQSYQAMKDTLWGCRYFASDPKTGQPTSTGSKAGKSSLTWPKAGIEVKYYVRIPAGKCRADMLYTPVYAKKLGLNVTITDCDSKRVIYDDQITTSFVISNQEQTQELFPAINFPKDTWYQIKLSTVSGGEGIKSLKMILFQHEATERVVSPAVFMAPSAHNNHWGTTSPSAPDGNEYDWIYGEFLYPEEYAFPSRYLMCLGGSGYYSGIQVCGSDLHNTALFSAWDNGDTDKNPNLPAYLRSGGIDNNPQDVEIKRFGAEGTGVQSMISKAHWKRGHWVQWLMNARPETTKVTLKAKDGSDSVITYANTILTAWYKMEDDPEWHYISTIRQSGTTHVFGSSGEYSFLECFTDGGGDNFVRCYMRNRFYRSVGSGKWYNRNHMTAGHYNYNDGARECRYDYGHGATSKYENCFYIEQGGFGQVNDSSMYIPLATNTECVDTINLNDKIERINLAFRNNYNKTLSHDIDSLMNTVSGKSRIVEMAKEFIDNAGQVGYFGSDAIANLREIYNNGEPSSVAELGATLKEMAQNYNVIRYANVQGKNFVGSQRAYIFEQTEGKGLLYAEMVDGKPQIKVGQKDRNDKSANWIIVRSDKYGTLTVYNIGLGLYVNFDNENILSSEPQNMTYFGRYGRGWYVGKDRSNALNVQEDGSVTVGSYNAAGSQFYLHDNLSYTPLCDVVDPVVDKTEAPGVFEEYKAKAAGVLSCPKGVLGAWTDEAEIEALRKLYDEGNITIDKAQELIQLIDNAKTISLKPNEAGAFILTTEAAGSEDTPYLTIDADNYIYHKAATQKPDQVWFASPKQGGHELSSQGRSLNSLSNNPGTTIQTKEAGNGAPYYACEQGGGVYSLSDVQYGPMVVSGEGSSSLKTASSSTKGIGWYLTPATSIKMSLNSIGVQSLYLDFDVKVPENVEVYEIVSFTAAGPDLAVVKDTIHAHQPVILKGEPYAACIFEIIPEQNFPKEPSLMLGTLLKKSGLKSKTYYTVAAKSGKPVIALTMGTSVAANQCYILKDDMDALGLTETQYDIDFDNITAVSSATASEGKPSSKNAYDLQGRQTKADAEGIVIKDGQKVLNK